MRGQLVPPRRAGRRLPLSDEAIARTFSQPAPYGGWNVRGNLANMPATDAILIDNVFPGVQNVQLRSGYVNWKTGFGSNIRSLMSYSNGSTSKLFAATNSGIYDATTAGAVGAAAVAATNGEWSYVNFGNSANAWLIAANGVDNVKIYDGSAWSDSAMTGVTSANLNYVVAHQKRLWFVEKNSMKLWYLGVESITGAATVYPVAALFKRGGYVVAIGTWTIDNGAGQDDRFVIVTSNGEIAVYQGTDPASSTTWALVGVYDVASPLGKRPIIDYGGDILYLSKNGLLPLSKLVQSTIVDRSQQLSFKIDGAFIDAADNYANNFGWCLALHKSHNLLIANIPVSADTLSYQFVMNTATQAWCRFTGWNASCWVTMNDELYFAGGTTVCKAWVGTSDNGTPIIGKVWQAYSYLGIRQQKNISLIRPNISYSNAINAQIGLDADFRTFDGSTTIDFASLSTGGLWDSGLWDAALWDGGAQLTDPKWVTVPGELGYMHSFKIQITTSLAAFTWTSTDFVLRPAGIL